MSYLSTENGGYEALRMARVSLRLPDSEFASNNTGTVSSSSQQAGQSFSITLVKTEENGWVVDSL